MTLKIAHVTPYVAHVRPYITKKQFFDLVRGHGGRVVALSPPTSEAGVRSPEWPYVGKLVVACHWSAVCSTDP